MKYKDPVSGNWKEVFIKVSDTLPVGSICQYAGSTAPSGYLMCNGAAVSRTEYSDLFAAIGTAFGTGDGVTTFNLPNFNGRVPVGVDGTDTDFDTIGENGGSKYLQEHSHIFKINSSYGQASTTSGGYTGGTSGELSNLVSRVSDVTTGNAGNLQPYLVTNFIIKASNKVALDRGNVVDSLDGNDTDSAPSVRAVNARGTYSTTEHVVGNWLGKPLYSKTFTGYTSTGNHNHNIANVDSIWVDDAHTFIKKTTGRVFGANYVGAGTFGSDYGSVSANTTQILIDGSILNLSTITVTLLYTKTTD